MAHIESADKYYKSKNVSALRPNGAKGPVSKAPPMPGPTRDVRSADTYYKNAGAAAPGLYKVGHPQAVHPVLVASGGAVSAAVKAVLAKLAAGQSIVLVEISDPALIKLMRVQLDLAVTRGEITEAQYRDIKFVGVSQPVPPVVPVASPVTVTTPIKSAEDLFTAFDAVDHHPSKHLPPAEAEKSAHDTVFTPFLTRIDPEESETATEVAGDTEADYDDSTA